MRLCVVGLGYIGLPTAALFADAGLEVFGTDKNPGIVEAVNSGEINTEEKGLASMVKEAVASGKLKAAASPVHADVFIITVPTPIKEDKSADMTFVKEAAHSIAPCLAPKNIVILESTSPVGTVDEIVKPILETSGLVAGKDFYLGYSPERVIPGNILHELRQNHRIAGGVDERSADKIADFYRRVVEGNVYTTDTKTAELCKLAENTYRDVNIAFANELAQICAGQGIDVWKVIELCNNHPRVNIHKPGPGVGGHCIAVDPWFIVEKSPDSARMITLARNINDGMPEFAAGEILRMLSDAVMPEGAEPSQSTEMSERTETSQDTEMSEGAEPSQSTEMPEEAEVPAGDASRKFNKAKVTLLGIAYKPDVGDIRESPLLALAEILEGRGIEVSICDPLVENFPDNQTDPLKAAEDSDILVLGVNHKIFGTLDFEKLGSVVNQKLFYDTANSELPTRAAEAGFTVKVLGQNRN